MTTRDARRAEARRDEAAPERRQRTRAGSWKKVGALCVAAGLLALSGATIAKAQGQRRRAAPWQVQVAGMAMHPGLNDRAVLVDGYPRRYLVYVPRSLQRRPGYRAPVVFCFHGSGGTGTYFFEHYSWKRQAEKEGIVLVLPTGLRYFVLSKNKVQTKWSVLKLAADIDPAWKPANYPVGAPWPADDLAFFDAMLADVKAVLRVNDRRVYATGFSNGAGFTARLGVQRTQDLAAVAGVGGLLDDDEVTSLPPDFQPIPTAVVLGNNDCNFLEKIYVNDPDPCARTFGLTAADLLATPGLDVKLQTVYGPVLGLDMSDYVTFETPNALALTWTTKTDQTTSPAPLRVVIVDQVTHEYPNGHNNPNGFDAPTRFVEYFKLYHK